MAHGHITHCGYCTAELVKKDSAPTLVEQLQSGRVLLTQAIPGSDPLELRPALFCDKRCLRRWLEHPSNATRPVGDGLPPLRVDGVRALRAVPAQPVQS